MRLIHFCSIAFFLFGITITASARDMPYSDPERKAILDAARDSPATSFVVKDLYRSGDFAWLCVLETVDGVIRRNDGMIEVNAFLLFRDKGVWVSHNVLTDLLSTGEKADCARVFNSIDGAIPLDQFNLVVPPAAEEDIETLWQIVGRSAIMNALRSGDRGRMFDGVRSKIAMLKEHGILEDFGIDYPKGEVGQGDIKAAVARCKDISCRKVMKQAAADLSRQQGDSRVSSLVWDNCMYGVRIQRTDLIASCIDTHMVKPYCRPGLRYFQDKKDIQRCLGDIAKECRSLPFEDDRARSAVCFMLN